MLPSCADNTSLLSGSQNYESSVKYAKFTKWGHFRYFTPLLTSHVIKHPEMTYSEKRFTLFAVFSGSATEQRHAQYTANYVIVAQAWTLKISKTFQRVSEGQMSEDQLDWGVKMSFNLNCSHEGSLFGQPTSKNIILQQHASQNISLCAQRGCRQLFFFFF